MKRKLMLAFLLVALIPLGVMTFLNNQGTRNALTENAEQALLAAASETAAGIDDFIFTNLSTLPKQQLPCGLRHSQAHWSASIPALMSSIAIVCPVC